MQDTSSSIIGAYVPGKKRDATHRKPDRASKPKKLRTAAPSHDKDVDPNVVTPALAIDCRYANDVPMTPVPKLLPAMPGSESFFRYKFTGLEDGHRPILLSEDDIVTDVEIMDPMAYGRIDDGNEVDARDAPLLMDDDLGEEEREMQQTKLKMFDPAMAKREAIILRRHILLSNDIYTDQTIFVTGNEAAEKKLYRDPQEPLEVHEMADRVEKTFGAACETPMHPFNPNMKAKRVLPVVPDFDLWGQNMQQVSFDEPPDVMELEDLLYKTVPNARTTCFSYFSKKSDGAEGEYGLIRNYVWDNPGQYNKLQAMGGEQLLLSFPDPECDREEIWFAPMPTRMLLSKQKAKRLDFDPSVHHLNVSYREPNAEEIKQDQKMIAVVTEADFSREKTATTVDYDRAKGEWKIKGPGGVPIDINSTEGGAPLPIMENPQDAGEEASEENRAEEEEELFGHESD